MCEPCQHVQGKLIARDSQFFVYLVYTWVLISKLAAGSSGPARIYWEGAWSWDGYLTWYLGRSMKLSSRPIISNPTISWFMLIFRNVYIYIWPTAQKSFLILSHCMNFGVLCCLNSPWPELPRISFYAQIPWSCQVVARISWLHIRGYAPYSFTIPEICYPESSNDTRRKPSPSYPVDTSCYPNYPNLFMPGSEENVNGDDLKKPAGVA